MRFYTNAVIRGDNILIRKFENGRRILAKERYDPTLFVARMPKSTEPLWHSIDKQKLAPLKFNGIRDAKTYIKSYGDVSNFKLFGFDRFVYSFLNEKYPDDIEFDYEHIRIASLDIEVASDNGFPNPKDAAQPIISITYMVAGKFYVYGIGKFETERTDIEYFRCATEKDILMRFIIDWAIDYPDIVIGWNVNKFDITYIIHRTMQLLDEEWLNRISPWGRVNKVNTFERDADITYKIDGITILDYLELYKKFTYTQQESYKLDHICSIELGEKKIDYSEYETLHRLYVDDHQKFIEYNIRDVELVNKLEDKLKLVEMAVTLAFNAKVLFDDVFTQVRMWDVIIHNYLWKRKIAVPTIVRSDRAAFVGGYVKVPQTGMHKWVMSYDLNSLYPHLIMGYNISLDTIKKDQRAASKSIEEILDGNIEILPGHSLTPNGCYFSNEKQGFLPCIMEAMYNDRVKYKTEMILAQKEYETETVPKAKYALMKKISRYKNMQMAIKIALNSAYGAQANPYYRHFNIDLATAITTTGQLSIRWIELYLNKYLNKIFGTTDFDYIIASDTDAIYINMAKAIEIAGISDEKGIDFLDKFSKKMVEPEIDKIYERLALHMNCYSQKMQMKRESIANRGIWTAKKRYILNVYDSEGVRYSEPKLKIMGIEAVKSSTPGSCRKAIKHVLKLIMTDNESNVQKYIQDFKSEFFKLPFEEIAFPRSVPNELPEYNLNSKGLPIHIRATLYYNNLLKAKHLTKKYEKIKPGDKIKFCYMKSAQNILAILNVLPHEFGVTSEIDYETQFNKAFIEPLKSIMTVIGWDVEKRATLDDFFS